MTAQKRKSIYLWKGEHLSRTKMGLPPIEDSFIVVSWQFECIWMVMCVPILTVNSSVPTTMRHGSSLHRICPKLLIDLSPSQIESQTSVRRPTLKLFGLSLSRLEFQASVRQLTLTLFCSSPSRLSFN